MPNMHAPLMSHLILTAIFILILSHHLLKMMLANYIVQIMSGDDLHRKNATFIRVEQP